MGAGAGLVGLGAGGGSGAGFGFGWGSGLGSGFWRFGSLRGSGRGGFPSGSFRCDGGFTGAGRAWATWGRPMSGSSGGGSGVRSSEGARNRPATTATVVAPARAACRQLTLMPLMPRTPRGIRLCPMAGCSIVPAALATLTYEMILMLNPDSGDEQRDKIAGDVKSKLESSGEVLHEAKWGLRKMAYEIEKHESSDYRFYRFNGDKPLLDDLDHSLKITDGVLRFRIFKTEPDAPIMVPPDTEQIMRRDEDDRDRGRGRGGDRGDRGPRRPRYEDESSSESSAPEAVPAAAAAEAPPAEEAPAAPAEAPVEAPAEPAEAPATEAEPTAAASPDAE
jgi:small subunit ribosomal protein S6